MKSKQNRGEWQRPRNENGNGSVEAIPRRRGLWVRRLCSLCFGVRFATHPAHAPPFATAMGPTGNEGPAHPPLGSCHGAAVGAKASSPAGGKGPCGERSGRGGDPVDVDVDGFVTCSREMGEDIMGASFLKDELGKNVDGGLLTTGGRISGRGIDI